MGLLNFLIDQLWFVVIIAIALVVGIRQLHTKQLIPELIFVKNFPDSIDK